MAPEFDVAIIGAGPAGCAAAFDLARAGQRVLLLDKRSFPRPKACACGLTRKTLKALRYSVDPVVERVCEEIVLQQARPPEGSAGCAMDRPNELRVKAWSPICAMAVRERFDDFCLRRTLAAGGSGGSVMLRRIESIVSLCEAGSRSETGNAVELDIATRDDVETLRVPVVIGADGSNGQTRRLSEGLRAAAEAVAAADLDSRAAKVDLPTSEVDLRAQLSAEPVWYRRGFALEAMVPFAELPPRLPTGAAPLDLVFDFAALRGGYGWLFPKGDHVNIGVGAFAPMDGASDAALKVVTRALLANYVRHKLGVAMLNGVTGQYLGMGGEAYVPRGRVLLVGDAAGLVDPLTGEGIHSAIVSGQAVAAAILACVRRSAQGDGSALDCVAAEYGRRLRPLQETLAFSARAARAFYAEPERGIRAMRIPLLRSAILRMYADGVPHAQLISRLVHWFV